jgi:hypothetical protein
MSWTLFKANVLRVMKNQPSIGNIDIVASVWAKEYDAAAKRGKDFINFESVQRGNLQIMESLFKVALLKGLTTPPGGNFSLPNEFGNGVKAYWVGAQMRPFPIPLIPAPGSIQNIQVVQNIVTTPGTWPKYPPLKPAKRIEIIVDQFILAAIIHLFSIGGIIQTVSLYPSAPSPIPGPGVINWKGYLIPPTIPIPNINLQGQQQSISDGVGQSIVSNTSNQGDTSSTTNNILSTANNNVSSNLLNTGTNNLSLTSIIDLTLPSEVRNTVNVNELIEIFETQASLQDGHCD